VAKPVLLPQADQMSATWNWNISDAEFPLNGTSRQKLGFAMKYALLAPPERNWQPWEFRLSDHFVELFTGDASPAGALDSEGRETLIACGAAMQYLKLALKHFGSLGRVEIFPHLDQPALAARIHAGHSRERDSADSQLFDAMKLRRPSSALTGGTPVSDAILDLLGRAVGGERGWLEFARSEATQRRLLDLTAASGRFPGSAVRLRGDSLRDSPVRRGDQDTGSFTNAPLRERFSRWTRPLLALKVRTAPLTSHHAPDEAELQGKPGTFAILKTKTDDKHGWIAAGQMMARLILHAQLLGLSWSLLDRALRQPEVRAELRTGIGHKGYAQIILRLGTAANESSFIQASALLPATATGNSG
jgi:hypothetical protein